MDTIARYLTESGDVKSVYAVVRTSASTRGARGSVKTWSLSRKAAEDAVFKEWEPKDFRVVKMTLLPVRA